MNIMVADQFLKGSSDGVEDGHPRVLLLDVLDAGGGVPGISSVRFFQIFTA